MKFNRAVIAASSVAVLTAITGCASLGTDGIVQIGPDLYMVGEMSASTYSGSAVKAKLFKDAGIFCTEKKRVMMPVNSTGQDTAGYNWASAEIQFRCLTPDDPRVPK
jgi:hypothetical protein